jgi:hypothetical protein
MAVEKLTFEMNAVGNAVPEMKKVQAQLGNVSKSMTMATAGLQKHANANRALVGANKNLTRNLGMASLQFQDMAVQASMGTDALRIMTMQAPQLASVFGPKGMILGAVVAIGGAFAMLGDKTTKLTFDFKKFGADMAVAFQPLIDFVRPAIDLVKKGFELLKTGAMAAVNGIINGLNYMVTFVAGVPAIVREAFTRAGKQIELFGLNVGMITNDIQFRFMEMFAAITSDFTSFINDTTRQINEAFNLNLPTDIGSEMMDSLAQSMGASNDQFEVMLSKSNKLRDELDKPYQSVTDLKDDLNNITAIDLFSYFDRVKVKSKETADAMKDITTVADMVGTQFETAFMSAVKGTKSVKDAFRVMAVEIIGELFRIFVVKQITGFVTSMFTAAFPSLAGVPARANGGPVNANTPYMVGERGPELFVPARSGSIMPNERVKGGGGEVIVQQTINVTTGVQQTVRNEIQTLLPQIAEASKAAVMDARKRGGSFANAF